MLSGALAAATAATGGLIHLAAPGLFFGAASGAVTAGGVGLGSITTGVALSEAADNTKEAKGKSWRNQVSRLDFGPSSRSLTLQSLN